MDHGSGELRIQKANMAPGMDGLVVGSGYVLPTEIGFSGPYTNPTARKNTIRGGSG